MCPTHSEAKLTETSESAAEKSLLKDHARGQMACAPNISNSLNQICEAFKGKVMAGCGWLLQTSW